MAAVTNPEPVPMSSTYLAVYKFVKSALNVSACIDGLEMVVFQPIGLGTSAYGLNALSLLAAIICCTSS